MKYINEKLAMKPKARSKLRIFLGKKYYTFKRYLDWYFGLKNMLQPKMTICCPMYISVIALLP